MVSDTLYEAKWRSAVRGLLRDLSADCSTAHGQLRTARDIVYEELARAFESPLFDYLKAQPHETALQKATLAQDCTTLLTSLGLAIRCPRTSRPAKLTVTVPADDTSGKGYFTLQVADSTGALVTTLPARRSVPEIRLMQDDPKRAPALRSKQNRGDDTRRVR